MHHVMSVGSIDELREAMPEMGESIYVLGHQSPGDGGGGLFHWQAGSSEADNDGTVIAVKNIKSGRWQRLVEESIDVRWFGAQHGDDATDSIQAALNVAKNGGKVRLPAGQYRVSKPLEVHQSTKLEGDGLLSVLQYSGPAGTGCLKSATPKLSCAFYFAHLNVEVVSEGAWAFDLRGVSFSRFDLIYVHLRKQQTSGYYGPGDGQSPYYNVFTNCHVSGPGNEDSNGCVAFNFTYDTETKYQSANANQVLGGHINSVETAVACYGTGNVFYAQVFEQNKIGYLFGLPRGRYNDASKGTSNTVAGTYTEYTKRVIVQEHETCYVTAELAFTTGYERVFDGKNTFNSVVLTGHDGTLEASRSFVHRRVEIKTDPQEA